MIQAAEEVVEHAKNNNLLRQEVIDAENELAKAVQAKNSRYQVQKAGLNAEARIASPITGTVEPTFNRAVNEGDPRMDVEHETIHYRGRSVALTDGQGIPNHIDAPSEQYDGIARMIRAALAKGQNTDPDKSVLMRASVKLDHPETYVGSSDLEEFEVFIADILRGLKMNFLLGETSIEMQVNYLGTCLTGEAQEWFYRNVEQFDCQVCKWTLEMVVQGLQRRFLHTLTHHHASNKFDMVSQRNKTVQEVLNDLKKYAMRMIHPPDVYTFRKWFVSALRDLLRNEVLKKGYNAEFSTIDQLYETARMIEEASCYNHGMRHAENTHTAASNTKPAAHKTLLPMVQLRTVVGRENVVHCTQPMCTYHTPKPEQKTVQVKDSSTKLSYRQKPLPQPPKREGNSMNITCYEFGQLGHCQGPHISYCCLCSLRLCNRRRSRV